MVRDGRMAEADLPSSFLELLDRERRYRAALREWQQYQDWMRNRNPIRVSSSASTGTTRAILGAARRAQRLQFVPHVLGADGGLGDLLGGVAVQLALHPSAQDDDAALAPSIEVRSSRAAEP